MLFNFNKCVVLNGRKMLIELVIIVGLWGAGCSGEKKSMMQSRKHKRRTVHFKIAIMLPYHGVRKISDIEETASR